MRLGLGERDLIRTRVDLGEKIALLDHLAFLKRDFGQLAVDLRLDGHHRQRSHGAERGQRDRDVAFLDFGGADWHRARGLEPAGLRRLIAAAQHNPGDEPGDDQQDEKQP